MKKIKILAVIASALTIIFAGVISWLLYQANLPKAPNYCIPVDFPEEVMGLSTDKNHPDPLYGYQEKGRIHIEMRNYKK